MNKKENFIDDDFLLKTDFARELFHDFAKNMPIIDYHNHLPPDEIANDKNYINITELWIKGDHYKWRAMRALGIDEKYISGNAPDFEKFQKWAYTIPYTLRNPLFHWSHMELKRYFNVSDLLTPESAKKIYEQTTDQLRSPEFSSRNLLKKMNVEVVCTSDDPVDDLSYHKKLSDANPGIKMLPTFRPDQIVEIDKPGFNNYAEKVAAESGIAIDSFENLLDALSNRISYFHDHGCRLSDHGLPYAYAEEFELKQVNNIFKKKIFGEAVSFKEALTFKSAVMYYLGEMYAEKNWVMQLHLGPIRNVNELLLRQLGANAGVDSIGDYPQAISLGRFLNKLNLADRLPKTILYNINPSDNETFATMAGNFCGEGIKTKVQFGAAWWFLDQKDGMTKQINALSNMGLISTSIGMLTDSRSFMSFPRHEYFRRILCNIFGNDIKNGELPNDLPWIGKVIQDICYNNAKDYFNFAE